MPRLNLTHILGIDPSIRATGVVLLEARLDGGVALVLQKGAARLEPFPPNSAFSVLHRTTLRTARKGEHLEQRLARLYLGIQGQLRVLLHLENPWVMLEDPSDFQPVAKRGTPFWGKGTNQVLAAFGALAVAVQDVAARPIWGPAGMRFTCVPSQSWIPKTRTKNLVHPMTHQDARAYLRQRWPFLEGTTDDETFAGGMALSGLMGLGRTTRWPES